MTENQIPRQKETRSAKTVKGKPYQKPVFRYERVFETAALSCGKLTGTSNACNLSRKSS